MGWWWVAQQNGVTWTLDFGLWTLDFGLWTRTWTWIVTIMIIDTEATKFGGQPFILLNLHIIITYYI